MSCKVERGSDTLDRMLGVVSRGAVYFSAGMHQFSAGRKGNDVFTVLLAGIDSVRTRFFSSLFRVR